MDDASAPIDPASLNTADASAPVDPAPTADAASPVDGVVAGTPPPLPPADAAPTESPVDPVTGGPTLDAQVADLSARVAKLEAFVASHLAEPDSDDITVVVTPIRDRVQRLYAHIFGE